MDFRRRTGGMGLAVFLLATWWVLPAPVVLGSAGPGCTDADGDGYGIGGGPSCAAGPEPDCDDADAAIFPGADEICDGKNNDCGQAFWPALTDWAQVGIPSVWGATEAVFAVDLDLDGDQDVVAGSRDGDSVAWYENTDGSGSAWTEHPISANSVDPRSIFATDADADGDVDVFVAAFTDGKVILYANANGNGTGWIERPVSALANYGAWSVFAADLDEDGDVDAVSADLYVGRIAWHENVVGDGTVWVDHLIDTGAFESTAVSVADIDGDDDPDVLSADTQGWVVWHENAAGDGSIWSTHVITTTTFGATYVYSADMGGDDDPDVLVAQAYDDGIVWFENTDAGAGPWIRRFISTDSDQPRSVVAMDMDGDADLDAVSAASGDGRIAWHENTDGAGTAWTRHTISTDSPQANLAVTADLNGDSHPDVVSASAGTTPTAWFRFDALELDTDGDGSAVCAGDCDDSNPNCSLNCVDTDTDGYCDPADCDDTNPTCTADCSDGDADGYCTFDDCNDADPTCNVDCIADIDRDDLLDCQDTCIDVDGDGYGLAGGAGNECPAADCDDSNPNCSVDCSDGDGDGYCVTSDCDDGNPQCTADCTDGDGDGYCKFDDCDDAVPNCIDQCEIDTDQDGIADCADECTDRDGDGYGWSVGPVNSCLGPDCSVYNPNCGPDCTDVDFDQFCVTTDCDDSEHDCTNDCHDQDGDGVMACLDCDDASATIYPGATELCDGMTNDCDNPFWPSTYRWTEHVISLAAEPFDVFAVDLDNDGDLDAVTVCVTDDRVAWHRNASGDGSVWTTHEIADGIDDPEAVVAGDIDGDGDLDVIAAGEALSEGTIQWYEQSTFAGSLPIWISHTIAMPSDGGTDVVAADVDGDGDLDVISAASLHDFVAWYENVAGDGSIWAERVIGPVDNLSSLAVVDLDGNGTMDIISAAQNDHKVLWHENVAADGSAWTTRLITNSARGVMVVTTSDLDGDGDQDVVSASGWPDYLEWHENTAGDGSTWTEHAIPTGLLTVTDAVVVDVDGDGDPDVISSRFASDDSVLWHENMDGSGMTWSVYWISRSVDRPRAVAAGDVDGDGDSEAFVVSPAADLVTWFGFESIEGDNDADGVCGPADCDDSNPLCGLDCTDADGDGACDPMDCNEADGTHWSTPGAVRRLEFESDTVTLTWTPPAAPGSQIALILYDTIRSAEATDFSSSASCVESDDGSNTWALDSTEPPTEELYFYLVRAENGCGHGSIGEDSSGNSRPPARSCAP